MGAKEGTEERRVAVNGGNSWEKEQGQRGVQGSLLVISISFEVRQTWG